MSYRAHNMLANMPNPNMFSSLGCATEERKHVRIPNMFSFFVGVPQVLFRRFQKRPGFLPSVAETAIFLTPFPETARFSFPVSRNGPVFFPRFQKRPGFLVSFPETARFSFLVSRNGLVFFSHFQKRPGCLQKRSLFLPGRGLTYFGRGLVYLCVVRYTFGRACSTCGQGLVYLCVV